MEMVFGMDEIHSPLSDRLIERINCFIELCTLGEVESNGDDTRLKHAVKERIYPTHKQVNNRIIVTVIKNTKMNKICGELK